MAFIIAFIKFQMLLYMSQAFSTSLQMAMYKYPTVNTISLHLVQFSNECTLLIYPNWLVLSVMVIVLKTCQHIFIV